jgi:hypothetical protein
VISFWYPGLVLLLAPIGTFPVCRVLGMETGGVGIKAVSCSYKKDEYVLRYTFWLKIGLFAGGITSKHFHFVCFRAEK